MTSRRQGPNLHGLRATAPHPAYCMRRRMRLWSEMIGASLHRELGQARVLFRSLMLVLAIASVPSIGLDALQRPHCVQHARSALHAGHTTATGQAPPGGPSPAWTTPATHDCPHCPASDCARLSPCAGSTTTALSPTAAGILGLYGQRVTVKIVRDRADSSNPPPDTPPPQPIT